MKLILKIEKKGQDGINEMKVETLEGASISIGRGESAQIRLIDPQLSLVQALIEISESGLVIREVGRPGNVVLNGTRVQVATLKSGDQLVIGAHCLAVEFQAGEWGLVADQRSFEAPKDDKEVINSQLSLLNIQSHLPSMLTISLMILFLLSFLYFLLPVVSDHKDSWNSGQVSLAHKFIEQDCKQCHAQPFQQVNNQECQACHSVDKHGLNVLNAHSRETLDAQRCASCHIEHSGAKGMHLRDSRSCVSCHGKIKDAHSDSVFTDVASFSSHPEFRLTISHESNPRRVEFGSLEAVDQTPLKLNHRIHLQENIRSAQGKVTLQCRDCHNIEPETKEVLPISFERNCRSCHTLEFDPRFPGVEVPHGDQKRITEFLRAHYGELLLRPEEPVTTVPATRIKPGTKEDVSQYNRATLELLNQTVLQAEEILYRKTGCQLCHSATKSPEQSNQKGAFEIQAPKIPSRWLPHAHFKHRPHLHVSCEHCHGAAQKSEETKDILLPDLRSCRECHADPGVKGKIDSDCVECHRYH